MELGKKIKQLRFKAGLTQEQLAEKLGIGAQSVSKWENAVAMPDITTLPLLAETFGVSIDDLFDLTTEQRLNRIENRMVAEEELPADISREFESFLQAELNDAKHQKRATELLAYFYWHRMNAEAQKASRYAKEAITRAPGEKCCQWILDETEHHAIWDWNIANHTKAVNFYRELVEANPDIALLYTYLLNNLIADHRADEAERWLDRYCALEGARPIWKQVYRAYIALARFDEKLTPFNTSIGFWPGSRKTPTRSFRPPSTMPPRLTTKKPSAFMNEPLPQIPNVPDFRMHSWGSRISMRSWATTLMPQRPMTGSLIFWNTNGG